MDFSNSQLESLFAFYSHNKDSLYYNDFVNLFNNLIGTANNSNFGLFFLIADEGFKGYITKDDWIKFIKTFKEDNSQFKLIWKFFKKFNKENDSTIGSRFNSEKNTYNQEELISIDQINTTLKNLETFINNNNNNEDADSINWLKINEMIHQKFLQNNISQINYKDLNNLIINELNNEKIFNFFKLNKNKSNIITDSSFKNLIQDLYSFKIDSNFINFTLKNHEKSSYNYNDVKLITNLLNKSYLINNIFEQFDGRNINDFLVNQNKNNIFTDYEINLLSNYMNNNTSSLTIINSPPPSLSNVLIPSFDKNHKFYSLFKSIYNFGLGAISGAIGATMVYPIDLVKTRMQAQSKNVAYKNSIDCFMKIISHEGPLKLYSGLVPQLVGVAPEKAIKLFMNDLVRGLTTDKKTGEIPLKFEIMAGSSAGFAQVVCTNPLEIVKIRLQIQGQLIGKLDSNGNQILKKTAGQIIKELGFSGLYKGSSACLLRDVPFSSIYFPTYSHLKKYFISKNNLKNPDFDSKHENISTLELLMSGAIAGMPAAYLTTPCDVIKTRLQMESKKGEVKYLNIVDTAKKIYAREGLTAFFKGGPARIFRSSPQFGFTLASYEVLQRMFSFDRVSNLNFSSSTISNESTINNNNLLNSNIINLEDDQRKKLYMKSYQALDLFKEITPSFSKFNYEIYNQFKNVHDK